MAHQLQNYIKTVEARAMVDQSTRDPRHLELEQQTVVEAGDFCIVHHLARTKAFPTSEDI